MSREHAHIEVYRQNRFMVARARQRMADLYDDPQTGRLSASLVASAAEPPPNCCSLGVCQASIVASAGGRKACCVNGTCFSDGWAVHH